MLSLPLSLTYADAIDAIRHALRSGLDVEAGPLRSSVDVGTGHLLLMPSVDQHFFGVKLVTIAPEASTVAARVQGIYVLFDRATLAPLATVNGGELTLLRTAATSAVAIDLLAAPDAERLVIFGTGPQAEAHIAAVQAVRSLTRIRVVGRNTDRLTRFLERVTGSGTVSGIDIAAGSTADIADADIVICATTASTPLFDGSLPSDQCTVVAVGSHTPAAREVDTVLVRRSSIVVDSVSACTREAGDLLHAGATEAILGNLAALATGRITIDPDRPRLFKSVGVGWQDLVVAARAYEAHSQPLPH